MPSSLQGTAEHYQTLLESIEEGFCIIEFFDGPHGPLSDYIHVEANAAYERNAGIPNVVGQKVREMVPDEADGWVELYGEVLRTGKPIQFQRELVATGRHLELSAYRVEMPETKRVAVLFKDVSDRVKAQAQPLSRSAHPLHHRLCRECRTQPRAYRAGHGSADQAVRDGGTRAAGGAVDGGVTSLPLPFRGEDMEAWRTQ